MKKNLRNKKGIEGLTLIEILLWVLIFGIFSALASYLITTSLPKKARDGQRKADLERLKIALYDYYFDANCFPKALPGCDQNFSAGDQVYLANFPCDPKLKTGYIYQVEDKPCSQWFKVLTNLENTKDPGIVKVGCQYGCGPECAYNYGLASSNIRINEGCISYYACTPSGECVEFIDPEASQCPKVFENDPTCGQGTSCQDRKDRCHDDRGKQN